MKMNQSKEQTAKTINNYCSPNDNGDNGDINDKKLVLNNNAKTDTQTLRSKFRSQSQSRHVEIEIVTQWSMSSNSNNNNLSKMVKNITNSTVNIDGLKKLNYKNHKACDLAINTVQTHIHDFHQ